MALQIINADTNTPWHPGVADWPILIHGQPQAGSSMFTVALAADCIRQGERVVFLCAKGEAIRALQTELGLRRPHSQWSEVDESAAETLTTSQLVTMFRRPGFDLLQSLRSLNDWAERIVIIKNFDTILTPAIWAVLKSHRRLIVSGDGGHSAVAVSPETFGASILFSAGPLDWRYCRSDLPRYVGECWRSSDRLPLIIKEQAFG